MTSYTPIEAAQALAKLDKTLTKEHAEALKHVLEETRMKAISGFISRGIGRRIFGKKSSGAKRIIRIQSVRIFNNGQIIASGYKLVGLAALQEAGGQTKKHVIAPRGGGGNQFLVFRGRSGTVFATSVNHPGSRMPAIPFAQPALENAAGANGEIARELEKATQAAANTVG